MTHIRLKLRPRYAIVDSNNNLYSGYLSRKMLVRKLRRLREQGIKNLRIHKKYIRSLSS